MSMRGSIISTQHIFLLGLFAAVFFIWAVVFAQQPTDTLRVSFLDVGQGDAIFIHTPSGRDILIDGGASNEVLRELGDVMPFWDRTIDMVVATHPDTDHIGGLIEVFKRYRIKTFLRPGVAHDAPATDSLFTTLAEVPVYEMLARRGQMFDFNDGVSMTVLFPDRDVSGLEPNDASVILQVRFGEHAFLLSGDAPDEIEEYIVSLDGEELKSTVLKVGHHGSRTSSSELFVGFVEPEYAVVSRGCTNRYGHPHAEVLDTFTQFEIQMFDTCTDGHITFETDGNVLNIMHD